MAFIESHFSSIMSSQDKIELGQLRKEKTIKPGELSKMSVDLRSRFLDPQVLKFNARVEAAIKPKSFKHRGALINRMLEMRDGKIL